jgi:long-chain acyl-CoA synthetase
VISIDSLEDANSLDPTQSMIVALIVPERNAIKAIQSEHQIDESNIKHAEIIKALQADLLECAKKAGFKGAEVLKNFTVLDKEFTAENGLLTAAQKIQRKNIAEEFQSDIDRMYGK